MPNTKLNTANFNISAGYNFSDKVRLEGYLNYNRQFTPNFPDVTYGPNSLIYNITIWGGADWDVRDMRNYWQPGKEDVQSIYAEYQRYHNPYFVVYEWLRGHYKTDINGYTKLTYKINKNLDLLLRTQVTTYDLFRSEKMPFSAHPYGREEGRGDYREDKRSLFENNTEALVNYTNTFGKLINLRASVGANLRSFRYNSSYVTTDYLNVPALYSFANSRNPVKAISFQSEMLVASAYGFVDIGISKYANLSVTGRVDKNSTLDKNKNGFYPSVSLSSVISDYVTLPSLVSFLKIRGSYANVKGGLTQAYIGATPLASFPLGYGSEYYSSYDGPTYENSSSYTTPLVYDNKAGAYYTNTIVNPDIKPFSSTVYEAGLDIRFLQNRVGADVTYFLSKDGPRIFNLPLSSATGFTQYLVNGITTEKKGWEITLNGSPFRSNSSKGFSWDVLINWSTFNENYTNFYPGVNQLNTFYKVGDRVDKLYGSAFAKTPEGQIINDAGGRPLVKSVPQYLGSTNPDWVWSINNTFRYQQFNLGFQFDGRVGGSMINYIQQQTFRGGRHIETVQGTMGEARLNDIKGVKTYVGEGVVVTNGAAIQYDVDGNITNYKDLQFGPNTTKTFLQDYLSVYYRTNEGNLISKTFGKLREVVFGYALPSELLAGSFIRQANVSFVARNLLYFSRHKDLDIDQYAGSESSSSLQTPTTKRYGINLNITF